MKKIAIVTPGGLPIPNVNGGGVESLIQSIIDINEIEKKLKITVFSIWTKEAENIGNKYKYTEFIFIKREKKLIRIIKHILYLFKIKNNPSKSNFFTRQVNKKIKKNNIFDKIIIENNLNFLLNKDRHILGEFYYHIHNDDLNNQLSPQELKKYRLALLQCKEIICVSNFIRTQVVQSINVENVTVLKNCIDISLFSNNLNYLNYRNEIRNKYNIMEDETLIMYSGRLIPEKGVKELILAFKDINVNLKIRLIVVGAGFYSLKKDTPYVKELKEICSRIKTKEIIFTGYIDTKEINKYYFASDIVVVPTLYFEEAAGLVAIEAMASQKPLIISNSGGLPEYASNSCCRCIERDKDFITNIKLNLVELIDNPQLREKMGNKGQEVAKNYNLENYYNNFLQIILGNQKDN